MPNFGALADFFGAVKSLLGGFTGLTGSLANIDGEGGAIEVFTGSLGGDAAAE